MPEVTDELPESPGPLSAGPPDGKPRRSPVKFILLGMLLLALSAGIWAYFEFRDRVSSDDAQVDHDRSAAQSRGTARTRLLRPTIHGTYQDY